MVPLEEIEKKNDFNLNLPRYIDSQKEEDRQDIEGHLRGGIPAADIGALRAYWDVYPSLKQALFEECRPGYFALRIDKADVRTTIFKHPEFVSFREDMRRHFRCLAQTHGGIPEGPRRGQPSEGRDFRCLRGLARATTAASRW